MRTLVAVCAAILLAASASPRSALADRALSSIAVAPQIGTAVANPVPPTMTSGEREQRERAMDELARIRRERAGRLPSSPYGDPGSVMPSRPSFAGPLPGGQFAPGDFTVYRNTLMTDTFTNDFTSSTDEPSLGMNCEAVLYTGNWYATVSSDGGRTFAFVDPATFFPGFNFCCDQVAYYEPSRGLMLWWLQGSRDANNNNQVILAVSTSNAITTYSPTNNLWTWYVLSPQDFGYGNGTWFDFPDMSVSDNFAYVTTDIIGASDNSVAFKLDLDELAAGGVVTFGGFVSDLAFLRPTHGAHGTMYIGAHLDTSTLRVYTWPEGDALPSSDDETVDTWFQGTYSAPSPDGTDWLNFGIPGMLGAWIGDGTLGFMWDSVQGGGFPWPNVRFVRFDESDLSIVDQGQIWNADYAWAYPSVHSNANGDIAGTMALGGGAADSPVPYPSFVAWIADSFNGDVIAPMENLLIATGNAGPASNRWGDFFTSRTPPHYEQTWLGTGFVLNGGQGGSAIDPYFLWFGREEDTPPPPTIDCPDDITVECSSPGGTSADDPQLDPFFGGVSASDVCGDPTVTNDAPAFFPLGFTNVTFTAESLLGFSSSCFASVEVVDTTPPTITCPEDIVVECTAHGGTPADDPQLEPFFEGVSATDVCDSHPVIDDDAPDFFPVGVTMVTFSATDDSGNESSCTARVTVVDTTPPTIEVALDRYILWPPNHKLVTITATVEVEDICDPNPTFVLTSIWSDEPDNGLGDGDQPNDIQEAAVGTNDVSFKLRSERQGTGDGRVYTITYTAADISGNTASAVVYVTVPHDQQGAAHPAGGFVADGTALEPGATTYSIAILSENGLDASEVLVSLTNVGNHLGVLPVLDSRLTDMDADRSLDLLVTYDVAATRELLSRLEEGVTTPVGLRYETQARSGYWLGDIFKLGPVLVEPTTSVDQSATAGPLYEPRPNPFTGAIAMVYEVGDTGGDQVDIAVINVAGQRIRTLYSGFTRPGRAEVVWDGRTDENTHAGAGIYFFRVAIGGREIVRRVTLLR